MNRPPLKRLMVLGASLSVMCSAAAFGQDVPAAAPSTDTSRPTTTKTTTVVTKRPSEASIRETQRRAAIQAVSDGNRLLTEKQLDQALARYLYALANLPEGSEFYVHARIGLSRVKYAQGVRMFEEAKKKNPDGTPTVDHAQRDKMLSDAEGLLREAVSAEPSQEVYRVAFRNIQHYRKYLAWERKNVEGVINNPAVTPEFVEQVNTVKRLFEEYKRFMETGQYDEANKALDKIIIIDKYNKTAIDLKTKVEKYRRQALDKNKALTKEDRMREVTENWYVRPTPESESTTTVVTRVTRTSPLARITDKLQTIRIPRVQFDDLDIEEVVRFLSDKSRQYDQPSGEGVNFVLKLPSNRPAPAPVPAPGAPAPAAGEPGAETAPPPQAIVTKVTLDVADRSLEDILQLISTLTNLQYRIEEYAIVLLPSTDVTDQMVIRTFQVPADFFKNTRLVAGSAGPGSTFVGDVQSVVANVKEELQGRGVQFPNGATATFIPGSSKLVVQNTPDQIEIIERLIESATMEVPMVEIETKLAEFTDDSIKELSFNYVLETNEVLTTTLSLPIASTVFSSNYQAATALRTGAATPGSSLNSAGSSPFGGITASSLDALLLSNTGNVIPPQNFITGTALIPNTPNTFAVGFRINGRGVQAVMSLLDNLKGVDLLAAPKVIAKNRSPAKIEVVRELRYPTEFERPEINSTIFAIDAPVDVFDPPATQVYLALPATPRTFESRNIGVTLEVTPTTYPDKRIDLDITNVEVVDFEGFINYGQAIVQRQTSDSPLSEAPAVSTGVVNQPVFNTRSIRTRLQVLDGESIVMGGLLREETQKIDDRVPILGDLPVVGRLFQSKVDKTFKRNLMIFLTARLIKSDGKPLNSLAIPITDETLLLPVSTSAPHSLEPPPFDAKDVEFRPIPLLPVDENLPR
ncbi:MAG TPA: hypothetical protein VK970_17525 [Candidatus Methylacidiphilales bacterium]|nr:hypothetical protein [Candidatus Methylacidiphilales bacterium]